jgi:predicted DsbA family dithiol-disulfide isomerase
MANKKYEDDEFDIDFKEDDDIETPLDDVETEDSEESIEEETVEEPEGDKAEEAGSEKEESEEEESEEDEEASEDEESEKEERKDRKKERKEEHKKDKKKEEKKKEHKMEKNNEKYEKKESKHDLKHKNKHKNHEEKHKKHEEKKDYKVKIKKTTFYRGLMIVGIVILLIAAIVAAVKFWPKGSFGGNYGTVKLDFYVMSQCPYGVQVEDAIGPVLKTLGKSVDFSINFIASEKTDGTFSSLHGQNEVNEDIRQMCVIKYYPDTYMDYILCINKDYQNAETIWESCAKTNGVDAAKIKTCFAGEGKSLLSESIKASTAIKASGSPTIYISDEKYAGARDSASFQRALCTKLNNHPACKDIPKCSSDADCTAEPGKIGKCESAGTKDSKCSYVEDARVNLVVLTDKRCTECDTDSVMQVNNKYFPNLVTRYVDYSTEEGKQLYSKYGLQYLPAYIFDKNINNTARYSQLANFFDKKSDNSLILKASAVGSTFEPNAEICTNGVDDNADGVVDCDDAKCKESLECRDEIKKNLDLFIMSQCPYGTKALDSMREVLSTFNGSINFNVNYIASENADGTFNSLHGQGEVEEDMRELCAMKYYPTKYKYMDYIWCRNKAITSTEWESCATSNGMDANKIKTCSEGTEGKKLLSNNIKAANALGIGASPTWMTNNKFQFSGLDANTIKTNYCTYNSGLKGCEKTLNSTAAVSGSCG